MNGKVTSPASVAFLVLWATLFSTSACADLRYEISTDKLEFSSRDRIKLNARLINEGDQPVVIYWRDVRFRDELILEVEGADGRKLVPKSGSDLPPLSDFEPKYLREIQPGGSWDFTLYLENRYVIRLPGTYTISSAFAVHPDTPPDADAPCWTGRVDAEPIAIVLSGDLSVPEDSRRGGFPWNLGTTVIEGRVEDQAGEPVADKPVHVGRRRLGGGGGLEEFEIDRAKTDDEGRFEFEQLPDDCPFFILSCPGFNGKTAKRLVPADPPRRRLSTLIILSPPEPDGESITIQGIVQDSRGQPISGVKVRARNRQDKEQRTDKEGRFELETVPWDGKVRLFAYKGDHMSLAYALPVESAERGPITLVLKTHDEMKAGGRIRFRSGRSVENLTAEFNLRDEEGEYVFAHSFRAAKGNRFEVVPQRDGVLSGEARFSVGRLNSDEPQPRWWTEVQGLQPGMDDAEIIINDTGSIEVEVDTADARHEIGVIKVRLELLRGFLSDRYEPIGAQDVSPEGGTVLFGGLCPGEYQVEVWAPELEHWRWSRKISLAEEDGRFHQTVRFPLPEIGYGSIRGRFVGEDGAIPVALTRAEIRPPARPFRRELFYNAEGEFSAYGVLSGTSLLTIKAEGYEEWTGARLIEPGKTTDVGLITLKPMTEPDRAEGKGVATGRLLYDDGTPVLGTYKSDWTHVAETDADGNFTVEISSGQRVVEFKLTNTKIWPGAYVVDDSFGSSMQHRVSGANWHGVWWQYSMVADFMVRPREMTYRDLVIPCRNLSPIHFQWLGEEKAHLRIGCFSTADSRQFQRYGEFFANGDFAIEIPDVRPGERVVTVRTDDLIGYRRFTPGDTDLEAVFGPSQCGSIEGHVLKSDNTPNVGVKVYACPAQLEVSGGIRSTSGDMLPFVSHLQRRWSALGIVRTDANGRFKFPKVSPGEYVLYVHAEVEAFAEVNAGTSAEVQIVSDHVAWGSGAPPLREGDE
jgi:protocatechuate 3,4-dioxygenase beta subunit